MGFDKKIIDILSNVDVKDYIIVRDFWREILFKHKLIYISRFVLISYLNRIIYIRISHN